MYQRKNKITVWTVVTVILLSTAVTLFAAEAGYGQMYGQERMSTPKQSMSEMTGRFGNLQSANKLMGTEIKNKQGETLGTVTNLILDDKNNLVCYVVLSAEGKLYPVPWSACEFPENKCILDMSKSDLQKAPSVSSLNMTELAGSDFRSKAQDFYSKQISEKWEPGPAQKATSQMKQSMGSMANPSLVELTDLIGLDIISPDNRSIGDLENIVIDVQEGTLAYGLVSHGGFWGIGERTSAVPWNALMLEPNRGVARLNATARNLDRADISRDNLEKLTQPAFARALFNDFNVQPYWEVYGYVAPEQMQMSQEAWAAGSIYNKDFDPKMLSTIQGTIESVGTFYPMKGAAPGLRLKVKTSDGQSMTVYAGPREYAKQKDFSFKTGSNISVTGSKTKVNGKSVLMASEINYGGKKLELRDSQGKPQWNMEQLRQQWQQWQQKESK